MKIKEIFKRDSVKIFLGFLVLFFIVSVKALSSSSQEKTEKPIAVASQEVLTPEVLLSKPGFLVRKDIYTEGFFLNENFTSLKVTSEVLTVPRHNLKAKGLMITIEEFSGLKRTRHVYIPENKIRDIVQVIEFIISYVDEWENSSPFQSILFYTSQVKDFNIAVNKDFVAQKGKIFWSVVIGDYATASLNPVCPLELAKLTDFKECLLKGLERLSKL
jgi:hypothetical protein